jgi:alpha/beta superfamily hydrolase
MKKFTVFFFTLIISNILTAQNKFTGTWNGQLNIAGTVKLVLHVTQSANGFYSGTLDNPDQNAYGIKCDKVDVKEDGMLSTLNFSIDKIKVNYTGKLINDSTLSGIFTQGVSIPLDLHKTFVSTIAKEIKRPQTPKPPFPYRSEEVIYKSPDQSLQYGGTITIPMGNGPFPAVVLITGSGPQDRDETIFDHKPFAVIADALTRDGFIVLRVDDRGIGNSTGNFYNSTTADFVKDVNTSVDYLKSRGEVDDGKIGLLGHSEGGMIAPMVAAQRKDIDFIVLRVDDRGIGKSTGNFYNSTTADFVKDVNTSIDYLKSRREIDDDEIGLLGHSEGGLIAPMVASQRKDIDFIVLLAAPGVQIIDLMTEQNAAILKASGISPAAAAQYTTLYRDVVNTILNAPDQNTAKQQVITIVNNWLTKTDTATAHILGFNSENYKQQFASQFVAQLSNSWMKYFLRIDPHPYLTHLKKVKVLALNGSRDIQVVSQQNLPALNNALREGRTKVYETKELYGLNHLFQTCIKCTVQEYGELEETISPVALQTITDWLNKKVK